MLYIFPATVQYAQTSPPARCTVFLNLLYTTPTCFGYISWPLLGSLVDMYSLSANYIVQLVGGEVYVYCSSHSMQHLSYIKLPWAYEAHHESIWEKYLWCCTAHPDIFIPLHSLIPTSNPTECRTTKKASVQPCSATEHQQSDAAKI
jgi:hypothetical protein